MHLSLLALLAGGSQAAYSTSIAAAAASVDAAATAYISSSDRKYNVSTWEAPVSGAGTPGDSSTWSLSVDDTASGHKQVVTGFGAAVTDATVAVINALPADLRTELLSALMTSAGADFSLLRHTVGASDLSADPAYTYDDAGGQADASLSDFSLGDRGTAMAELLAEMQTLNSNAKLLGSVWAPPAWMQLDRNLTGSTVNNNLDHSYVDSYAQYFVKYIQAYADKGARVDAITIQNEPLNSQATYPTMYVYADESGSLIQDNVGPALKASGLNTEIWAYDHNTDEPSYPQTVIDTASEFVNTVAWHCYATDNQWSVLTDFHNSNPGVDQYMTECWTSSEYTAWSAASGFTIGPLQNWAQGSLAWTLATDQNDGPHLSSGGCDSCRGLVVVNTDTNTYEFQVDYYMMAQYSKFIPQGAVVLNGTGSYTYDGGSGIQSVASLNPDGTRTVVIENTFSNDVYVTVDTTSGQEWSGNVYANSVVTWILP
ncbi:Endo-1,6-beta-D-glucanase neg1 [Pestalotiopsis sp. 9143b]|nr:Endo-1,6-beta-D-glucanase neg1 [Pestalotiopsis sp. 9143b]